MVLMAVAIAVTGVAQMMSKQPPAVSRKPDAYVAQPQTITKTYYRVPMDTEMQDFIHDRCKALKLDERLVYAVINNESTFRNMVSSDGEDYGIMQINKVNHRRLLAAVGGSDVMDVRTNILMGTYLLAELRDYWRDRGYAGDELEAAILSSYNKGIAGYSRGGVAREYVTKIAKFKEAIEKYEIKSQVIQSSL